MIEYDTGKNQDFDPIRIREGRPSLPTSSAGIGFIGAGSYAMSHLLPNLPRDCGIELTGVMTASGTSSRSVAQKFGFSFVAGSADDIINDDKTGAVFIATRHDSHAAYVQKALTAGKNVFVEKPLCLAKDELRDILGAWEVHKPLLMVGFNRRFSPFAQKIKTTLGTGPMSMLYRINAGSIPENSWIQDADIGGGRIIGEACHFVDFLTFINGSVPTRVYARALRDPSNLQDTVSISLEFENGSIGTICYFANGPKSLAKEYVEIFKGGVAARLLDFKELEILGCRKPIRKKLMSQDKGQKKMVESFLAKVENGGECPISIQEILATSVTTFGILDSLRSGTAIDLAKVLAE
jgi:polar amino acid transport system substrate-binding protein